MSIKLIAIDLDGTLLNNDRAVAPAVKQAILAAKAQGVHVLLATGRPFIGAQQYLRELELDKTGCYCLCNNGGLIVHAENGEPLFETLLDFSDYLYLESLSHQIGSHFHALDHHKLYTANRDISKHTVQESFITGIPLYFCPVDEMDKNTRFPKVMMIDDPEVLEKAIARIPPEAYERYTIVRSSPNFLEILNKDADKGKGVARMAEFLNIPRENVMCIGDHGNDLAMVKYAGVGVAMGNAEPSIKEAAQFVTTTNQEDGVAVAINKFVFEK
ncbi:sugar-phosphatase [Escherichia coli]|uniref:sugar-phosphatase n=1 Tax=Hafnia paralvei TaxID=546367 RepID=UPI000BB52CBF|nr:sugar-phosphatase [Hafnia paralvei]EJA4670650.1 sugar-phosphatase [Escherichia coli]MCE9948276.1 sugar-phosphatase [Hafnia paralvei]PNK66497.1 sugar-phosphatase [Hafnia paralvei]